MYDCIVPIPIIIISSTAKSRMLARTPCLLPELLDCLGPGNADKRAQVLYCHKVRFVASYYSQYINSLHYFLPLLMLHETAQPIRICQRVPANVSPVAPYDATDLIIKREDETSAIRRKYNSRRRRFQICERISNFHMLVHLFACR